MGRVRADEETRLFVTNAQPEDTGNYSCVATNMAANKKAHVWIVVSGEYSVKKLCCHSGVLNRTPLVAAGHRISQKGGRQPQVGGVINLLFCQIFPQNENEEIGPRGEARVQIFFYVDSPLISCFFLFVCFLFSLHQNH